MKEFMLKFDKKWHWYLLLTFLLAHVILPRYFVTYYWLFLVDLYLFSGVALRLFSKVISWQWYHKTFYGIVLATFFSIWVFVFIFVLSIWTSVR